MNPSTQLSSQARSQLLQWIKGREMNSHQLGLSFYKYVESFESDPIDLKSEIQGVREELKEEIQGVRMELRETREELSAKIEAVGAKVDGHEDRIRFLERKVA